VGLEGDKAMDESQEGLIKQLYEIEGLSMRQIATRLGVCRKRISLIIKGKGKIPSPIVENILTPYKRIIAQWYKEYPSLKAIQVYERLVPYGFKGSYPTVCLYTRKFRNKKSKAYYELEFLPGEEAQIDWMVLAGTSFGTVYGFVFILSYSRYLYCKFYPKQSMEFFLDGHIEAFQKVGGIVHTCRYDNLKSVVIQRKPELKLNPQFLDFSRHYGFSIYLCNVGKANEKGRVERVIRDIRNFLRVNRFDSLKDLNKKFSQWRCIRNEKVHRSTGKTPLDGLKQERLRPLPQIPYKPYRVITTSVSRTGFVSFETNRYSVPIEYCGNVCQIFAYPDQLKIVILGKTIANHSRCFDVNQKKENPLHRQRLLKKTPHFKYQRIYQLVKRMDKDVSSFLHKAENEGQDPLNMAYEIFQLLKVTSKYTLCSAIRQANNLGVYRLKLLYSLLKVPQQKESPVYPQDQKLLKIEYRKRDLKDYDEFI
jgi:transposase